MAGMKKQPYLYFSVSKPPLSLPNLALLEQQPLQCCLFTFTYEHAIHLGRRINKPLENRTDGMDPLLFHLGHWRTLVHIELGANIGHGRASDSVTSLT